MYAQWRAVNLAVAVCHSKVEGFERICSYLNSVEYIYFADTFVVFLNKEA